MKGVALIARLLYMQENVTDEDFHLFATGEKVLPRLNTYKIVGLEEI